MVSRVKRDSMTVQLVYYFSITYKYNECSKYSIGCFKIKWIIFYGKCIFSKPETHFNTFFELNLSSFITFIYYITELAGLAK